MCRNPKSQLGVVLKATPAPRVSVDVQCKSSRNVGKLYVGLTELTDLSGKGTKLSQKSWNCPILAWNPTQNGMVL